MSWPTPRWFGWPAQDAVPTRTVESGSRPPGATSSNEPSPPEKRSPAQGLETLAALAPALCWTGRRPGHPAAPTPAWQPLARIAPALSGALNLARGGPVAASHAPRPTVIRTSPPLDPPRGMGGKPGAHPIRAEGIGRASGQLVPQPASLVRAVGTGERQRHEEQRIASPPRAGVSSRVAQRTWDGTEGGPGFKAGAAAAPAWGLLSILPGLALRAVSAGIPEIRAQRPTEGAGPGAVAKTLPPLDPPRGTGGKPGASPMRAEGTGRTSWQLVPQLASLVRAAGTGERQRHKEQGIASPPRAGVSFRVAQQTWEGTEGGPAPGPVPRPERRQAGREPGPYISSPLQGLNVVTHAVERLVERKVKTEIGRQRKVQSQAPGPTSAKSRPAAVDINDDETVRRLMQKMHALARDERFRSGRPG